MVTAVPPLPASLLPGQGWFRSGVAVGFGVGVAVGFGVGVAVGFGVGVAVGFGVGVAVGAGATILKFTVTLAK